MSEADLLRRAAAAMRERAEAVPPSPWWAYPRLTYMGVRSAETEHGRGCQVGTGIHAADGTYIASWHPTVALAVADWLDAEADVIDAVNGHHAEAAAVARAYLEGAS